MTYASAYEHQMPKIINFSEVRQRTQRRSAPDATDASGMPQIFRVIDTTAIVSDFVMHEFHLHLSSLERAAFEYGYIFIETPGCAPELIPDDDMDAITHEYAFNLQQHIRPDACLEALAAFAEADFLDGTARVKIADILETLAHQSVSLARQQPRQTPA